MFLYRYRVRKKLGDAAVVWINPRRMDFHAGSNQPYTLKMKLGLLRIENVLPPLRALGGNKILYSLEPFSIRSRLLRNLTPLENVATYRKIADVIACRDDPSRSIWFKDLMADLERTGVAVHKELYFRSEEEIRAFFAKYVGGLINSMERTGYDVSKGADIGTAMIGEDGKLIKSDAGNHRFSVARILGVPRVPLEILGAHEKWMRDMKIGRDLDKLKAVLRQVEEFNR
ncbi:MAG: hypothetical protein MUE83_03140 [Tabrizicola sp.]|jgi:hypothetical protein|nr:hypothetical protein [Tabrizicola sp.]